MPFQKGYIPWNKDLDWKPKSAFKKGTRPNIKTEFKKGHTPWNKGTKGVMPASMKGKHHTTETKRKISMNRKAPKGENHYAWTGGKYSESYRQRRTFRDNMQKLVFERDNYTCQLCGNKGDLQVDHIQSWAEYVELRFKLENCRTVCAKCHYKITFGKPMPKNIKGWGHNFLKGGD